MNKEQLKQILEALIFASDSPLPINQIRALLPDVEKEEIEEALKQVASDFEDHSFLLKKISGGYQFATRPEYSRWIKQMYIGKERSRLTRAALETLAIIAFKQPISKVEVSAIRGVNVDGVVKNLLERKLISITGRDDGPGRSLLFCTTKEFLQYFGINDISDLPKPKEIEELLAQGEGERIIQEIPEETILQDEILEVEISGNSTDLITDEVDSDTAPIKSAMDANEESSVSTDPIDSPENGEDNSENAR